MEKVNHVLVMKDTTGKNRCSIRRFLGSLPEMIETSPCSDHSTATYSGGRLERIEHISKIVKDDIIFESKSDVLEGNVIKKESAHYEQLSMGCL